MPSLARNPLSLVGIWLTTLGAFAFIAYYIVEELGLLHSPYAGMFGFLFVPAVFVVGLVLIPVGIWREARRRHRGEQPWRWPVLDLGRSRTRHVLLAVAVLSLVNVTIVGVAGFGAVHYMETDRFCGQVCHQPMSPEFVGHQQAPHANVGCVECHVSPGAAGTVRAKLNGTRQAYQLVTGTFSRPIPSPVRNLPVAADTCWQCHSPGHPQRDITLVKKEYDNDEANTETATTVLMYTGKSHWHARTDVRVEYIAGDPKREKIPYVKVTGTDGRVTEYFAENVTAPPPGELRRMDCLDCHSRPAHAFSASPDHAVDGALASGEVSTKLPFVRREMLAALKADYPTEAAADEGIRRRLTDFYRGNDAARSPEVARAIDAALRLYRQNVFPAMNVTWGTYANQLGHSDVDGCFRCHDDEHKTKDGKAISQDCDACHKQD